MGHFLLSTPGEDGGVWLEDLLQQTLLELVQALPLSGRRPCIIFHIFCLERNGKKVTLNDDILVYDPWGKSTTGITDKRHFQHFFIQALLPSPGARLPKKSPQAVKDRFCNSRPCVATLKGQHHLTLGLSSDLIDTEERDIKDGHLAEKGGGE